MSGWTPETLKERQDAINAERLRLGGMAAGAIVALVITLHMTSEKAMRVAFEAERTARILAVAEVKAMAVVHNDIIRKGEVKDTTYVTRANVYSALATALVVIGVVIAYYANFGSP